jgi:hypothetical protein
VTLQIDRRVWDLLLESDRLWLDRVWPWGPVEPVDLYEWPAWIF